MFIVSDNVLERLICSQCKKYLSVKTVKVYPNRGIKCGRCSNAGDAGVVSLFGVLAEEALFRCVNRFEGCNQLLSYSDVAEHEKYWCHWNIANILKTTDYHRHIHIVKNGTPRKDETIYLIVQGIGKEYECPSCVNTFKGTGYEIYIHFKEQHPQLLLLNNPEFILGTENELVKSYLYCKNDLLFYVDVRYNRSEEELNLNVRFLGTDQDASKITQMFSLHSLGAKVKYKTHRETCCSATGGNLKCFRVNIPADFPKNVVVCRFDLNTENAENLIALPGICKKSKHDLKDNVNNIIKPSAFGKGIYPVTIFNPTTSGSTWGLKTDSTPSSSCSFGSSFFSKPITNVCQSLPSTTTVASSIFGKSSAKNSVNQPKTMNFQPLSTASPDFSIFGPLGANIQPITTTVSSSLFGKPTDTNSISQPGTTGNKAVSTTETTIFSFGKSILTSTTENRPYTANSGPFYFLPNPSTVEFTSGNIFELSRQGNNDDKKKHSGFPRRT